jgi:hypothetical protein
MIAQENKQTDIYELINYMKSMDDMKKINRKLEKIIKKV